MTHRRLTGLTASRPLHATVVTLLAVVSLTSTSQSEPPSRPPTTVQPLERRSAVPAAAPSVERPGFCDPAAAPPEKRARGKAASLGPLPTERLSCASLGASTAPGAAPYPPSVDIPGLCGTGGGGPSNYTTPPHLDDAADRPYELHVIGVYEPRYYGRPIDVQIMPTPRPVALVLTSYEAVEWRLDLRPGARVVGVYAASQAGEARVTKSPVPPQILDASALCDFAYGWEAEHNSGGGSYEAMIGAVRARFGHREQSFQGCYDGQRFTIPYSACPPVAPSPEARPTLDVTGERIDRRRVALPGCESILAQKRVCLSGGYSGLRLVGLDDPAMCTLDPTPLDEEHPSFAWRGRYVYRCTTKGLLRYDLASSERREMPVACRAILDTPHGLLVRPPRRSGGFGERAYLYRDGAALLRGEPSSTFEPPRLGDRMALTEEIFYVSGGSLDAMQRYDLATSERLPDVPLQGHDDWIWGLDVIDGLLVMQTRDGLKTFDAESGAARDLIPLPNRGRAHDKGGLACIGR